MNLQPAAIDHSDVAYLAKAADQLAASLERIEEAAHNLGYPLAFDIARAYDHARALAIVAGYVAATGQDGGDLMR